MSQLQINEFKIENLRLDSNIKSIPGKNVKLIDFFYKTNGKSTAPPPVELGALPLRYAWNPASAIGANKLCFTTNNAPDVQSFMSRLEAHVIKHISEMSETITGDFMDESTIRDFKWHSNTNFLKVNFDVSKASLFTVDEQASLTQVESLTGIKKGSVVYPVVRVLRVWYADQFGISIKTEGIAVEGIQEEPFDFILDDKESFPTNRLMRDVDYKNELDFNGTIYTNQHGGMQYYLDAKRFQLDRMACPFGYQASELYEHSGTICADVSDPKMKSFFDAVDQYVADEIANQFSNWFSSRIAMTGDKLMTHLYSKTIKASKDPKWPDKLKFKINTDTSKDTATKIFVMNPDGTTTVGTSNDLTKGCSIIPQIEIGYVWFKGTKQNVTSCGTTLVLRRVLVYPNANQNFDVVAFHSIKRKVPSGTQAPPTKRCLLEEEFDTDLTESDKYL